MKKQLRITYDLGETTTARWCGDCPQLARNPPKQGWTIARCDVFQLSVRLTKEDGAARRLKECGHHEVPQPAPQGGAAVRP